MIHVDFFVLSETEVYLWQDFLHQKMRNGLLMIILN